MSVVSGVVLCASCTEEYRNQGEDGPPLWFEQINGWIVKQDRHWGQLKMVEYHFGGRKHPQMCVAGGGFNYFDEDAFVQIVLAFPWESPENVVLVIEPEDGPTRVFRPNASL